jgi:uncharacterized protein
MTSNQPTSLWERIQALDILRGIAVFGILVVNVEQMFLPMLYGNDPVSVVPGEAMALPVWFFTDALFENKFITLFSLLFGAGFALQWHRARDGGAGFRLRYLRRLLLLAIFGLLHAAFFYGADVLVIYALTALLLIPWRRSTPRKLTKAGGILLAVTVAWGTLISGPDEPTKAQEERAAVEAVDQMRQTDRLVLRDVALPRPYRIPLESLPGWSVLEDGRVGVSELTYELPMPTAPAILLLDGAQGATEAQAEYAVYSRGSWRAACFARLSYLASLVTIYTPVYLGWRTLALFLLGSAVAGGGLLTEGASPFWRRARGWGLALGLPMTIAASTIRWLSFESQSGWVFVGDALHDVSSLLLAAGIGGAVFCWAASDRRGRLRSWLAAAGRTALTNYIGQSVVMSLLATSYGFGWFGDLSRATLLGLAVVCFALQLAVSSWWLSRFRMGPLEWIWRCFTYWQWAPLRRERTTNPQLEL